jgi:hypothetical protein
LYETLHERISTATSSVATPSGVPGEAAQVVKNEPELEILTCLKPSEAQKFFNLAVNSSWGIIRPLIFREDGIDGV